MSEQYPAEPLPPIPVEPPPYTPEWPTYAPMMRPPPDIDQADRTQTYEDWTREEALRAMLKMERQMQRQAYRIQALEREKHALEEIIRKGPLGS